MSRMAATSIEEEEYYHGLLPRDDVNLLLTEQGEFLVRCSEPTAGEPRAFIISICVGSTVKHFVVQHINGKYTIDSSNTYESVVQLIEDYRSKKTGLSGSSDSTMKKPIARASWELTHEWIQIDEKIGEGAFGSVNKGALNIPGRTSIPVAIKVAKTDDDNKLKIKEMMKEARLMRNYTHPHIVRIYGVAVEKEPLLIVMEFVTGGDLLSYVKKDHRDPKEKTKLCAQAAWGVEYLHSKNCIHRDLATRNCLLGGSSKNRQVKISDFGLSREGSVYLMQTARMLPIRWIPPEILKSNTFSPKSDVWSFGVLMWEVFADGLEPFHGTPNAEVKDLVLKGITNTIPDCTPKDVADVMTGKCWVVDLEKRSCMYEIARALDKISGLKPPIAPEVPEGMEPKKKKLLSHIGKKNSVIKKKKK